MFRVFLTAKFLELTAELFESRRKIQYLPLQKSVKNLAWSISVCELYSVVLWRFVLTFKAVLVNLYNIQVGLFGRRPAEKPWISEKNRKARLTFAKEHLAWTANDWKKVLWSDESKFNMVASDGKGYVRRPVNKRFDPKYTKGTVKFGGGNIMVWGCFSWHGLGPLHRIVGRMDQIQYRELLLATMLPYATASMEQDWV